MFCFVECSAIIDWNAIAEQLKKTHKIEWHTSTCQKLWKYIAYGCEDDASAADENDDGVHSSSDSEAYEEQEQYTKNMNPIRECKKFKRKAQDPAERKISLFPAYDLPFSANGDGLWVVDKRLSLAFTASQFLRKKKLTGSNLTTDSVATDNKTISSYLTSTSSPAPITSHMSASYASDISRTTPVSQVTQNEADDQAKQVKIESKANATASPGVLANSKPIHKSGIAPPPLPKPLMTSFQFFCKMYGGNAAWKNRLEDSVSSEAALRKLFAEAPSDVLRTCASMVEEDRRRFNREHLRRSLWEKAYFLHQVNIN
uniref:AlNc14C7G935 protein n=1 Tax=Albugo laibachii Nc14 TaxID=890382 RepID=F0W1G6_9STRA|nr:AlNc14C7G935 [Albugo laibachii Nc14]|eukprot:CCA14895.1 AlNc14C7G935 [Albugo laibachii Nc14]